MRIKKIYLSNSFWVALLTLAFLGALVFEFYPLHFLENKVYDILSRNRHRESGTPVVIVAIDDESVRSIGSWPWPRDYIADMVRQLSKYGANTLGLDLLYTTKELNSGLQEIKDVRERLREKPQLGKKQTLNKIDRLLANSEKRLNHDNHLISAVKSARNVVLPLRFDIGQSAPNNEHKLSGWLRMNSIALKNKREGLKLPSAGSPAIAGLLNNNKVIASRVTQPFSELSRKSGSLGHINLTADRDGVIRTLPLVIDYQDRDFISFSLQIAMKYMRLPLKELKPDSGGLHLRHMQIPTDSTYRMLIDFSGREKNIRKFSFSDVRNGKTSAGMFRNKIVLLGITAEGMIPKYRTSVHSEISGVEIMANAVENLVNRKHVSRPLWVLILEVLALLYFGFFLLFVIPKVKPKIGASIMGIFLITWIGATWFLFFTSGIWLKTMTPILLTVIGFSLVGFKRLSDEKQDENAELNKTVGLALQGQGQLDMAFEKFLKCPIEMKNVKDLLYNLGLDFERKRMFNKALAVYIHILKAGTFKDIKQRIKRFQKNEGPPGILDGSSQTQTTLLVEDDQIKTTLGRYEILEELGQGAMGKVYLGRDPSIHRDVAIKTLNYAEVEPDQLEEIKSRFLREAEAAGKLSHPNIVTIFDVGEDHDIAFMAMELLKGDELTSYCEEKRLLPVKRVLSIVSQVAQALDYAHSNGVVHRDIKPSNILLLEKDQTKVADFGIARVMSSSKTETGTIFGTPGYMSPEQVAGKKVDGRSDLFSLGIVFYELLSGAKPFQGDTITALMYAIANTDHVPLKKVAPKTPSCCVAIVNKLLTKGLNKRFNSAEKVVDRIQMCLETLHGTGR
jgi:serine/threonine-protein kinase